MKEQEREALDRWSEEDGKAVRLRRRRRKWLRRGRAIRKCLAIVLAALAVTAALLVWKQHERRKETESCRSLKEAVDGMREDRWAELGADVRLECLKSVAGVLAGELGIEAVRLCAEELETGVLGRYSPKERRVTINLLYLREESAETMLHTLAHEVYHAYQHALVLCYSDLDEAQQTLALFQPVRQYQQEFAAYVSGAENMMAYAEQQCEKDCDAYAEKVVQLYSLFLL